MNLKKKWNRFWTLNRHHEAGFTLVELIVVIAIMAILAGVGTAGYGGYIKMSNKNADKVLVGNVMRAIETGTNSTMFVNDDSFKMGKISYPVGFVTLSTEGTKVVTSNTNKTEEIAKGSCKFVTIEGVLKESTHTKNSECPKNNSGIYIRVEPSPVTISYCTTHSHVPADIVEATGTYISDYTHSGRSIGVACLNHKWEAVETPYPSGKRVANLSALFLEKGDGFCEYAYANQNATFAETTNINNNTTDGPLYGALEAAFGSTNNLKLKYDGWADEGGFNYATILSSSGSLIDSVKETADKLLGAKDMTIIGGIISPYIDEYLSDDYQGAEDMMESFSGHMMDKYPSNDDGAWDAAWANAATSGIDYTFGMNDETDRHHDFVYAATKGYNSCFASYCAANNIPTTFTSVIENFTSPPNANAALQAADIIPRTVNHAAFEGAQSNHSDKTLKDKFIAAGTKGGYTQEASEQFFNECHELYKEYVASPACAENGKVFYDMMDTVNATSDIARNENNATGGDYFEYYGRYLGEMSELYKAAEEAAKGGVVIIVTVENGELNFQVSPSAALPPLREK